MVGGGGIICIIRRTDMRLVRIYIRIYVYRGGGAQYDGGKITEIYIHLYILYAAGSRRNPREIVSVNHGGVNTLAREYGMNPGRRRRVYGALGFSDH